MAGYEDTRTSDRPQINLVGFLEQSVERLIILRDSLRRSKRQFIGANPEPIDKESQPPMGICVVHHMDTAHRLMNEIEVLAQELEQSVGHSTRETKSGSAGIASGIGRG